MQEQNPVTPTKDAFEGDVILQQHLRNAKDYLKLYEEDGDSIYRERWLREGKEAAKRKDKLTARERKKREGVKEASPIGKPENVNKRKLHDDLMEAVMNNACFYPNERRFLDAVEDAPLADKPISALQCTIKEDGEESLTATKNYKKHAVVARLRPWRKFTNLRSFRSSITPNIAFFETSQGEYAVVTLRRIFAGEEFLKSPGPAIWITGKDIYGKAERERMKELHINSRRSSDDEADDEASDATQEWTDKKVKNRQDELEDEVLKKRKLELKDWQEDRAKGMTTDELKKMVSNQATLVAKLREAILYQRQEAEESRKRVVVMASLIQTMHQQNKEWKESVEKTTKELETQVEKIGKQMDAAEERRIQADSELFATNCFGFDPQVPDPEPIGSQVAPLSPLF